MQAMVTATNISLQFVERLLHFMNRWRDKSRGFWIVASLRNHVWDIPKLTWALNLTSHAIHQPSVDLLDQP